MGVVRTDIWLEEDFSEPVKICNHLIKAFEDLNEEEIYWLLVEKGMYRPNHITRQSFNSLKQTNIWGKMARLENLYRKSWNGPSIPIYIFPSQQSLFERRIAKTGYTYPDKIFLFIGQWKDFKEVEALFVHEYHHATRLKKTKKPIEQHTLLDSLIMEGLAEHAVGERCGERYVSHWCKTYEDSLLQSLLEKHYLPNLKLKINEERHHNLLFGKGLQKPMLGYAIGYFLVMKYCKNRNCAINDLLSIPAETFLH